MRLTDQTRQLVASLSTKLNDDKLPDEQRAKVVTSLVGVRQVDPGILPAVGKLLGSSASTSLQKQTIETLGASGEIAASRIIASAYPKLSAELQDAAFTQLIRRADGSMALLDAIKADEIKLTSLSPASVHRLRRHNDAAVAKRANELIDELRGPELKEKMPLDELKILAAANAGSVMVQMALGQALVAAKDLDGAMVAFERAAALLPRAGGRGNPHAMIARVALEKKDTERAIKALEASLLIDPSDVEAARQVAGLVASKGNDTVTEAAYKRVVGIDPFDSKSQTVVGRLAFKRKDNVAALRAFRSALATQPADRAAAHTDLGEALLASGDAAEAKKQTLEALEIAPSFECAQDLLLKLAE